MDPAATLQAFSAKWHAAWPEQDILQAFVPPAQRAWVAAWGALLHELHESVFALEHDTVREAKSLWWSQELQAMSSGQARHPLGQVLQALDAPYAGLAGPVLSTAAQVPIRAGGNDQLLAALMPMAEAAAACERALFGGELTPESRNALAVQWLLLRLPQGLAGFDRAMVPMQLLARHPVPEASAVPAALRADWLDALQALTPAAPAGNWYREAQRRFALRRIRALRTGDVTPIGPGHAWDAWRARRTRR